MLIGRHEECDVQLESRKVSRRHCCIAQVEDRLVIRDLESTNGIRVNGTPVQEATIADGDEVTIGNLEFEVQLDGRSSSPKAEPKSLPQEQKANDAAPSPVPLEELVSMDIPVPICEPEDSPPGVPAGAKPGPTERGGESAPAAKRGLTTKKQDDWPPSLNQALEGEPPLAED